QRYRDDGARSGGAEQCIYGDARDTGPDNGKSEYRPAGPTESQPESYRPVHALGSRDDNGELRSRHYGSNANRELGDDGDGGGEHRSGGSDRKPERNGDHGHGSGSAQ